jgi:hypothetical protein
LGPCLDALATDRDDMAGYERAVCGDDCGNTFEGVFKGFVKEKACLMKK